MNKPQIIEAIATLTKLSKSDVTKILDAFAETCKDELKKGEDISLMGFLNLKKVKRSARSGRNPKTGIELKIAAKNIVKAKVGKALHEVVQYDT